jgi:Ca2+-binding RTX toxin-like protein
MALRKWGSETLVNTNKVSIQSGSSVAALPGGGYVVAWHDFDPASGDGAGGCVKFQRYDAGGLKLGGETIVNTTSTGNQQEPDIAVLADGSFVVVFRDDSNATGNVIDSRFRHFAADGTAIDATDRIALANPGTDLVPRVTALPGGGFVVVSQNGAAAANVLAQRFDATGATVGAQIDVAITANLERVPVIAVLADGSMAVAFHDNTLNVIQLQRLNADGTLNGAPVTISNSVSSSHSQPSITALAGGGFVVAWADGSKAFPDTSIRAIHAQLFSNTGVAVGGEFVVNTITAGDQFLPDLVALPDGGFVSTYVSSTTIMAQIFNADATRRGAEYQVNTSFGIIITDPSVTVLNDGRLVVSWSGNSANGSDADNGGVYQQILDPRDGLVNGTGSGETLYGNDAYGDEMNGLGGADTLFGLAGADVMFGGDGGDILNGGRGDDTIYGGNDGDNIRGDAGDDELYGEVGGDTLLGGFGADFLNGGDGFDFANYHFSTGVTVDMNAPLASTGEAFGDSFFSIEGLVGSASSSDTLLGDVNQNIIFGQGGADTLDGRGGNDTLYGGAGADIMTGGTGPDRFQYVAATEGGDTITDFAAGDKIQLVGAAFGIAIGPGNSLAATAFRSGAGNTSTDGNTRMIVDTTSHTLWYDSDGTGATGPILLATFSNNYNPIIADFLVT